MAYPPADSQRDPGGGLPVDPLTDAVQHRRPEVLHALGHLLKGISLLFWALPVGLLVLALTFLRSLGGDPTPLVQMLRSLNILPAVLFTLMMATGAGRLRLMHQGQTRARRLVEALQVIGWINFGLSPFLYWWSRMPEQPFFQFMVILLAGGWLLYLALLNRALQQLTALLPDAVLRDESRMIGRLNQGVLFLLLLLGAVYYFKIHGNSSLVIDATHRWQWLLFRSTELFTVFLLVIPVATTMAVLWKIRELILASIFQGDP